MTSSTSIQSAPPTRWRLSVGYFTGLAAWTIQLIVGYGFTLLSCLANSKLSFLMLSGLAALITLVALFIGWNE